MAYFSQQDKARIAPQVKAICKKYGVTASLAVDNHMVVVLNIKSAKIDLIGNYNDTVTKDFYLTARGFTPAKDSLQVNTYHYRDHFSGVSKQFLEEVIAVLNGGNHDNSDIQTDYFDVGWYVNVNVGKWNKPFTVSI